MEGVYEDELGGVHSRQVGGSDDRGRSSHPQIVSVVAPRERAVEPSLQRGQGLALLARKGPIVADAREGVVAAEEGVERGRPAPGDRRR